MTTEARTNLGPPAASPADAPRNIHRLVTRSGCGDNLLPRRSDTPRAAASLANRWSTDGPQTVQRLTAHFDHLPATAATCHPGIQPHLGLPPFSPADGFRAHCPQPVHHRWAAIRCRHYCHCCLFRQIRGPFPDKTHLSRHDKQAYQKRIRTGAERRRNGSAIRRPISCGLPRRPASILAAASCPPL